MVLKTPYSFEKYLLIVLLQNVLKRGWNLGVIIQTFYEYECIRLEEKGAFYGIEK